MLGLYIILASRDHIVTSCDVATHAVTTDIDEITSSDIYVGGAALTLEAGENTAEEFIHMREPFGQVTDST